MNRLFLLGAQGVGIAMLQSFSSSWQRWEIYNLNKKNLFTLGCGKLTLDNYPPHSSPDALRQHEQRHYFLARRAYKRAQTRRAPQEHLEKIFSPWQIRKLSETAKLFRIQKDKGKGKDEALQLREHGNGWEQRYTALNVNKKRNERQQEGSSKANETWDRAGEWERNDGRQWAMYNTKTDTLKHNATLTWKTGSPGTAIWNRIKKSNSSKFTNSGSGSKSKSNARTTQCYGGGYRSCHEEPTNANESWSNGDRRGWE